MGSQQHRGAIRQGPPRRLPHKRHHLHLWYEAKARLIACQCAPGRQQISSQALLQVDGAVTSMATRSRWATCGHSIWQNRAGQRSTSQASCFAQPWTELSADGLDSSSVTATRCAGTRPPPRFLYSMDSYSVSTSGGSGANSTSATDTRLVVFGGESLKQCYMNDLWEFSVLNSAWELKSALAPDHQGKCAKLITK